MKLSSSVLFVSDIEVSKAFYSDILDQKVEHDFGKNIIYAGGLAIWQINPAHVIADQLHTSGSANRFELYFESDNLEDSLQRLEAHSVQFLHRIIEEPWGQRTMRFFDPDAHLIEIGETMPAFVRRMSLSGMSSEQIADKTHIALHVIQHIVNE